MKKLLIVLMVLLGGIISAFALSAGTDESLVAGPFERCGGCHQARRCKQLIPLPGQ